MNKSHTKSTSQSRGFTLIELMVVIVIIGILASLVIMGYGNWRQTITTTQMKLDLNGAATAMGGAKSSSGTYPTTIPSTFTPSEDITLIGGSYNGKTYCIEASSAQDASLIYHIISGSSIVESGECPDPVTFVTAWGGTIGDYGYSMIQTSDDGYAVTGRTDSYGAGSTDVFIAKYDSDGSLSWSKTWGGTGYDDGRSIIQTSDDGFAISGYTNSYGAGGYDMFLAKYTSNGTLSWSKTWGKTWTDVGRTVVQTADGGFAVSGYTRSYGAGESDMFLAKYTSDGDLSWSKTWGGAGFDDGRAFVQTADGGFAVSGHTNSYGAGGYDMFLAKYTSNGDLSWSKTWGGIGDDVGYSLIQTSDVGLAVSGSTISYGAGDVDMFITKYTSDGTLSWSKTWGGNEYDYGRSIIQTNDGGFAVTGDAHSYGVGSSDVFLAKYTSDGNLSWSKTWGGIGYELGRSVVQTDDGGFAVSGYTLSYGAGGYDMFLAKYAHDGTITNCSSPMCQSSTATVTNPTVTVTSPTATVTTPSPTVTTPSPTVTSPTATTTMVVAP